MVQTTVSFNELDELYTIIEETFDTCSSSREELYWLIAIIKILTNNSNKYTECTSDNAQINYWIYSLYPIIENWKRKYHHSTQNLVKIEKK